MKRDLWEKKNKKTHLQHSTVSPSAGQSAEDVGTANLMEERSGDFGELCDGASMFSII
jgi:hypothetical protein